MLYTICLVTVIWAVGPSDDCEKAISIILRDRGLPAAQEKAARDALATASRRDSNLFYSLVFSANARTLLDSMRREKCDIFELLMIDLDESTTGLIEIMGKAYRGDGVLSGVRYKSLASESVSTWLELDEKFDDPHVKKYLQKYADFREQGLNSAEAAEKLSRVTDGYALVAADVIVRNLEGFGTRVLTGYQPGDALKDKNAFLEAWYSSQASGEQGVAPADCPRRFIANMAMVRLRQDLARNMIPINKIISRELQRFEKPSTPTPSGPQKAEEDDPSIGLPGKAPDTNGWIVAKVQPGGDLPFRFVRRGSDWFWQSSWPSDWAAGYARELHFLISADGLRPDVGETYEIALLPWVKARDGVLTLVPGDEDAVRSVYSKPLSNPLGQVEMVFLHVKVKRWADLRFRLRAKGPYWLAIGEVYVRRVR